MNKRYLIGIGLLVLLVSLFGLVLTCQRVADPQSDSASSSGYGVYAPPFDPASMTDKSSCQAACNEYYDQLKHDEKERHKQAIEDCGKDKECKAAENELYKDNLAAIQEARLQCIHDCHDQGDSGGGF